MHTVSACSVKIRTPLYIYYLSSGLVLKVSRMKAAKRKKEEQQKLVSETQEKLNLHCQAAPFSLM